MNNFYSLWIGHPLQRSVTGAKTLETTFLNSMQELEPLDRYRGPAPRKCLLFVCPPAKIYESCKFQLSSLVKLIYLQRLLAILLSSRGCFNSEEIAA